MNNKEKKMAQIQREINGIATRHCHILVSVVETKQHNDNLLSCFS